MFSFFPSNRGCDDTHPTDGVPVGPARGQADSNTGPQSPVGLSLATRSPGGAPKRLVERGDGANGLVPPRPASSRLRWIRPSST